MTDGLIALVMGIVFYSGAVKGKRKYPDASPVRKRTHKALRIGGIVIIIAGVIKIVMSAIGWSS